MTHDYFGASARRAGSAPFGAPLTDWLKEGLGTMDQMANRARMGRGDVRAAILTLLAEQPMHGYQIIHEIQQRSGGVWRPSPGSVYPTLQMLTDEGLLRVEAEGERKTYALTEEGRAVQADPSHTSPFETPTVNVAEKVSALPKAGMRVAQAVAQFQAGATREQVDQAVEVLEEARRKLYLILAEG